MTDYSRSELAEEFQRQGDWRRQKAIEYPDDKRNAEAAALFDVLAASAETVDPGVLAAYAELFEDLPDGEAHSELMRSVGFDYFPADADAFCRRFIANRTA